MVPDRRREPPIGVLVCPRWRGPPMGSAKTASGFYSPVAFAMISFDTFAGTSAYESKTME